MENTKLPAFPLHPELVMPNQQWSGLSKHEYAAIIIAQGLVASDNYNIGVPEDRALIGQRAHELAAEVLNQFKY